MYEKHFADFSYVDQEAQFCEVRLNEPYAGVQVVIAKQFVVIDHAGQQELNFDYEVTQVPDDQDPGMVKTPEFINFLRNIFLAILEEHLSQGPIMIQSDPEKTSNE